MLKTPLVAAAIGMALITSPSIAGESDTQKIIVKFKDLDLSSADDQKELDRRIDRAAETVCEVNSVRTGTRMRSQASLQCVKEARATVKALVAAKIEKAGLGG